MARRSSPKTLIRSVVVTEIGSLSPECKSVAESIKLERPSRCLLGYFFGPERLYRAS